MIYNSLFYVYYLIAIEEYVCFVCYELITAPFVLPCYQTVTFSLHFDWGNYY